MQIIWKEWREVDESGEAYGEEARMAEADERIETPTSIAAVFLCGRNRYRVPASTAVPVFVVYTTVPAGCEGSHGRVDASQPVPSLTTGPGL